MKLIAQTAALIAAAAFLAIVAGACGRAAVGVDAPASESGEAPITVTAPEAPAVSALPAAVIYRTAGADCADLVPVTLNSERTAVVSYPAPTDITPAATPVPLADGWLLDRRGIGSNTAFTRWTYAEYAAMKTAPSPAEILSNIVADARVSEIARLPLKAYQAAADTTRCNDLIRRGNFTVVYTLPHITIPAEQ